MALVIMQSWYYQFKIIADNRVAELETCGICCFTLNYNCTIVPREIVRHRVLIHMMVTMELPTSSRIIEGFWLQQKY